MSHRDAAGPALLCWMLLILIATAAQRWAAPESRDRREARGYELLQEQFLIEERAEREAGRRELLDLYQGVLDGFRPIVTRLRPLPDASPQRHTALLEAGAEEGVRPGQGVIGRAGVVGVVAEVEPHRARIILSDDPAFRVRFHIPGKGRGIAAGGPGRGEMRPVTRLDPFHFESGDLLLTRGGSSPFPRSLVIAEVVEGRIPVETTRLSPPPGLDDTQEVIVLGVGAAAVR